MVSVLDNREWVDYFEGQKLSENYSSVEYVTARGKKVEVPAEPDIEAQIAEIIQTCGTETPIRLYLEENAV